MSADLNTNAVMDVDSLRLEPLSVDPADVVSGAPAAGILELLDDATVSVGVWELTPGVVTDTETDEIFVVVRGRAEVELLDEDRVLTLGPGTLGRLTAGSRTRWTVSETLRKVYISLPASDVAAIV